MPDFKAFVRDQVTPLALPPDHEDKIVAELAAQLEEAYDALVAEGLSEADAWTTLQRQLPEWSTVTRDLIDAEPAVTRLAQSERIPVPAPIRRRLLISLRERLTTGLVGDLRGAFRLLKAARAFSAAVILTLAICLGANAAIFTVVHSVLLRPLPIPEPDRIVALGDVYPTITPNDVLSNDVPSYFDRLEALTSLDEQAMFTFWFDTIRMDGVAEEVRGMRATPSLFRLLRVQPALGRTFADAEGKPGAERKVILSHALWQRLYGADPGAIGKDLRLGWTGQPYTIVGVMPPEFSFFERGYDGHSRSPNRDVQFWIPLAFTAAQKSEQARTRYGYFHVGRLRSGATVEQLQAQVNTLHTRTVERFPEFRFAELGMFTLVTPLHAALTREVSRTLYLLWAAAGFVLAIGTINIANLTLARASVRARELATRLALGATRFHVTRQLMIEGVVPATIGGVAGVAVGSGILRVLSVSGMENLPNASRVQIDSTVTIFITVAAVLIGILIGVVPAVTARSLAVVQALGDGNRSGTDGRTARLFRRALIVVQVALSVVLLIGAGLLLTSLHRLLDVDPGFSAARVTTATIFPPPSRYPDAASMVVLTDHLLERVRAIPGVAAAGTTSNIALSGFESPSTVSTTLNESRPGEAAIVPSIVSVSPGYFEAMSTPLLRGRGFSDRDRAATQRVAIVDQRLAARLWPGDDPIGKTLYRGEFGPYTIVGIVRDVRFEDLAVPSEPIGAAYFPHTQAPPLGRLRWIAVKTTSETSAIAGDVRSALAQIDPDLPLSDIQTMTERTSRALVSERLTAGLATTFGLVALALSTLGIYGVLAYVVARRTREIGIRIALGSTVRGVFRLVFSEGLRLIAIGLVLGLGGALALGRTLEGHLFGVHPTDPVTFVAVAAITASVALLACVAPAVRATRVDPIDVLAEQ